ncbi:hypothetical protein J8246_07730 [Corynebacterium tuberculostearicum]|uniref:hypothetical protein n=1 Tax=Corynebacterium TaxID=1716 RepID=UPI001EF33770|nr:MULTISPECIES: hypothetical protein [Corynebacterium]MCG7465730.1 hypothetical protein [Corynebacterium sp. ACRPJ]WKE52298.1 hypothetical protein J8246_07730 [Corynebacterium tuberculostearicum]
MDADTSDLLFCIGSVLVMVLFWAYYLLEVRRNPRSEEWYDEPAWEGAASDGVLFYYPYGSLMLGAGGVLGLVASVNPPEFVGSVVRVVFLTAVFIGAVGMTGGFGIPLPWPFVPRWVVDIRKAKRARRRERREARKREGGE